MTLPEIAPNKRLMGAIGSHGGFTVVIHNNGRNVFLWRPLNYTLPHISYEYIKKLVYSASKPLFSVHADRQHSAALQINYSASVANRHFLCLNNSNKALTG